MEIRRIESTLADAGAVSDLSELRHHVEASLREATSVIDDYERLSWPRRVGRGGRTYELALSSVLQASEDLFLVASAAAVVAQVPALKAAVRTYLGPLDSRSDDYVSYLDTFAKAQLPIMPGPAAAPGPAAPIASP